jgi:hypothetical protein
LQTRKEAREVPDVEYNICDITLVSNNRSIKPSISR